MLGEGMFLSRGQMNLLEVVLESELFGVVAKLFEKSGVGVDLREGRGTLCLRRWSMLTTCPRE